MSASSSGLPDPGGRVHSNLGNSDTKRRRKNDELNIWEKSLLESNEPVGVRYVILKPANETEKITENPFRIAKEIDKICGKVLDVNRLKSGDVLVKAKSLSQAKMLLNCKRLPITKTNIDAQEYGRLNQTKGKIYRHDFHFLTDEEIRTTNTKGERGVPSEETQ